MSDTKLKKQYPPVQGAAEERQPQGEVKDISKLLSSFGGFNAVRGFLPDADNLNPARKANDSKKNGKILQMTLKHG